MQSDNSPIYKSYRITHTVPSTPTHTPTHTQFNKPFPVSYSADAIESSRSVSHIGTPTRLHSAHGYDKTKAFTQCYDTSRTPHRVYDQNLYNTSSQTEYRLTDNSYNSLPATRPRWGDFKNNSADIRKVVESRSFNTSVPLARSSSIEQLDVLSPSLDISGNTLTNHTLESIDPRENLCFMKESCV